MSKCRSCGAEIVWLKTDSGKSIPVDAETVVDEGASIFDPDQMTSHFDTCPDAEKWRKVLNSNPKEEKRSCENLYEKLAEIEHQRWADWQRYCHKILREKCPSPELEKAIERWERQIYTPYRDLSEKEKQSDRDQVDRYWHLIEPKTKEEKRSCSKIDTCGSRVDCGNIECANWSDDNQICLLEADMPKEEKSCENCFFSRIEENNTYGCNRPKELKVKVCFEGNKWKFWQPQTKEIDWAELECEIKRDNHRNCSNGLMRLVDIVRSLYEKVEGKVLR